MTSVDGGAVGSADYEEVVLATYSGRVIGLTKEPIQQQPISQEVQDKLKTLRLVTVLCRDSLHSQVYIYTCTLHTLNWSTLDAWSNAPHKVLQLFIWPMTPVHHQPTL